MPRFYEEVNLGGDVGPKVEVISDKAVVDFISVWDPGLGPSRFTSEEVAKAEGLSRPIVPGIMTMSLLSQLLTTWAGPLTLTSLDVIFRQPVPHNQSLKLHGVITDMNKTGNKGVLEVDVYVDTSEGNRLIVGKATLSLPLRNS
jgi:acyl dehydratase